MWWCGGVVVWWCGGVVVWWCSGVVVWCGVGGVVVWWCGSGVVQYGWFYFPILFNYFKYNSHIFQK